jgi:dethiobiotin synthetase
LRGPRPEQLIAVVGTGTDVGKTYVSASLLATSRNLGMTVAARKPVQSFDPKDEKTDADLLGAASGEEPTTVCPRHRWYEVPYAPPMAADSLERPVMFNKDLLEELVWPYPRVSLGVVEMVGGVLSPIAHDPDQDQLDLIRALEPDRVILVADAGLGTVNAINLTYRALVRALGREGPEDQDWIVIVLNRFDAGCELHQLNDNWLAMHDGLHTTISPVGDFAVTGWSLVARMWPSYPERY